MANLESQVPTLQLLIPNLTLITSQIMTTLTSVHNILSIVLVILIHARQNNCNSNWKFKVILWQWNRKEQGALVYVYIDNTKFQSNFEYVFKLVKEKQYKRELEKLSLQTNTIQKVIPPNIPLFLYETKHYSSSYY